MATLTELGATVVPIATTQAVTTTLNEGSGSTNEMKHDLDEYIARHLDPNVAANSIQGIIDSGKYVPSRLSTYNQRKAITPTQYTNWMNTHTAVLANGRTVVTAVMDTNDVDAMIYPSAGPYTTIGTNLRLSPNTGMPAVSVPMGQTIASDNSNLGVGVGVNLEFLGRAFDEGPLLGLTYAYEQATRWRTSPALYPALAPAAPPAAPAEVAAAPANVAPYVVTATPSAVQIGDEVQVTVKATGARDLYAYDLDLGYDPDVLEYVDGSASTPVTGTTYVTDDDGDLHVVHTKLGTSPALDGQADLVTLTFKAIGAGDTTVTADGITKVATDLTRTSETSLGSAGVAVSLRDPAVATKAPLIEGNSKVGQTLTVVSPGTWDLTGVTYGYQWLNDGLPIANATGPTYKVRKADLKHKLSVRVTASLQEHADGVAESNKVAVTAFGTTIVALPLRGKVGKAHSVSIVMGAFLGPKVTGAIDVYYGGTLIKDELAVPKGTAKLTLPAKGIGSYPLKVVLHPTGGTASAVKTFTFKVVK